VPERRKEDKNMAMGKVTIKETLVRVTEVEAEDAMAAEDLVRCAYDNSEIVLEADDFSDVEITAEQKEV